MEFIRASSGIFVARDNIIALEIIDFEGREWVVANLKHGIIADSATYSTGGNMTYICRIAPVSEQTTEDSYQKIYQTLSEITYQLW